MQILNQSPKLYQPTAAPGYDILGVVQVGDGRTGALARAKATGQYVLLNANAQSSLDQASVIRAITAHNVTTAREAKGWSKRELARQTGLSEKMIRLVESQDRHPSVEAKVAIYNALGLPIEEELYAPNPNA